MSHRHNFTVALFHKNLSVVCSIVFKPLEAVCSDRTLSTAVEEIAAESWRSSPERILLPDLGGSSIRILRRKV